MVEADIRLSILAWAKFGDNQQTGDFDPSVHHVVVFRHTHTGTFPPASNNPMAAPPPPQTAMQRFGAADLPTTTATQQSHATISTITPPVRLANCGASCPTNATIQCVLACPMLVAAIISKRMDPTDPLYEVVRNLQIVLPKAMLHDEPTVTDLLAMHKAFRANRPAAEASDPLDDATSFSQMVVARTGTLPKTLRKPSLQRKYISATLTTLADAVIGPPLSELHCDHVTPKTIPLSVLSPNYIYRFPA